MKKKDIAKKFVSAFLALVMFAGHIPQLNFSGILTARSSVNDLGMVIARHFSEGNALMPSRGSIAFPHVPGIRQPGPLPGDREGLIEGQATLSWPLEGNYSYELVFPMTNGHVARLNFIRTGDETAFVTYRVYTSGVNFGVAAPPGNFLPTNEWNYPSFRINVGGPGIDPPPNFMSADTLFREPVLVPTTFGSADVIWPEVPPGSGTWVPAFNINGVTHLVNTAVIPNTITFNDEIVQVLGNPADYTTWTVTVNMPGGESAFHHPVGSDGISDDFFVVLDSPFPFFGIQPGLGFSFTLGTGALDPPMDAANAVHFFWDEENDEFIVTTGGLEQGFIYEFHLSRFVAPGPVVWDRAYWDGLTAAQWTGLSAHLDWRLGAIHAPSHSLQRVFTGFRTEARPVARHRNEPRGSAPPYPQPPLPYDQDGLFFGPGLPALPSPLPDEPLWPLGFTNWNLPAAPGGPPVGGASPLWNHWNILYNETPRGVGPDGGPAGALLNDLPPGEDTMMIISVARPMIWSGGAFIPSPNSNVGIAPGSPSNAPIVGADFANVTVNVLLNSFPRGTTIDFNVTDLFDGTDRDDIPGVSIRNDATYVNMIIHDVPHSTIFDPRDYATRISVTTPGNFPADVHTSGAGLNWMTPIYGAFTFMWFDVEYINGNFHVRIAPYVGHAGRYRIITPEGHEIAAPVDVTAGHAGDIFMPINVWALDVPIRSLQVIFEPHFTPFPDVHSQVMQFRPTFDRTIFTVPANFEINPTNPPLVFTHPDDPNRAQFTTMASWDVSTLGMLNEYFEFLNAGRDLTVVDQIDHITIRYLLRRYQVPFPEPNDDVAIVDWVDVHFRRVGGAIDPATGLWRGGELVWYVEPPVTTFPVAPTPPIGGTVVGTFDVHNVRGLNEVAPGRLGPPPAPQMLQFYVSGPTAAIDWLVTDEDGDPVDGITINSTGLLSVAPGVELETQFFVWATTGSDEWAVMPMMVWAQQALPVPAPGAANAAAMLGEQVTILAPLTDMPANRAGVTPPPNPLAVFNFPNIYHLTTTLAQLVIHYPNYPSLVDPAPIYTVYFRDADGNYHLQSNSAPLTLDRPAAMDFPTPQNLRAYVGEESPQPANSTLQPGHIEISFDVPGFMINNYVQQSIFTQLGHTPYRVGYRVILTENEAALRAFMSQAQRERRENFVPPNLAGQPNVIVVDLDALFAPDDPPMIDGNPDPDPIGLPNALLTHLREQRILVLDFELDMTTFPFSQAEIPQLLRLYGLDLNRHYFVAMDAYIYFEFENGTPDPQFPDPHFSLPTNVAGVTTHAELAPPDPSDLVPPSPQDLRWERELTTLSSVTLSWLQTEPLGPAEVGTIRYEVIRIRGDQIPVNHRVLADRNMQVEGPGGMREILAAEGIVIEARQVFTNSAADPANFEFWYEDGRAWLENYGLAPNTLYFYYVRVIWDVTGGGTNFSTWQGVSATTDIPHSPENLRVLLATWIYNEAGTLVPFTDYDPRHEFVIRFDMRLDGLAGHGSAFDFQYSLMRDSNIWDEHRGGQPGRLGHQRNIRHMNTTLLEAIAIPGRPGYFQFTYVISGLRSGQQYSIRVRAHDLINNDFSQYSNIATTRTEADQDDIDRDRDEENLRQYLRDLIDGFLRRHYWIAQNSQNTFSALYRPSMMNNLLEVNDSMIRLAVYEQNVNVYYLPQALFQEIWRSEQGFIIQRDDIEIAIPHSAFNNIDSEAILQAARRVRDERGVEDYYVRITAMLRPFAPGIVIHGQPPAGLEVVLQFEVVEASTTARQLDLHILDTLTQRINNDYYARQFFNEIGRMLDRGDSFEYMVRRLHQMAESVEHQMAAFVNGQLLPTLGRVYEVRYVSQPITIRLNNQAASSVVGGFQFASGSWVRQYTQIQGGARVMRTQVTGAFAFNIQRLNMPGLGNMQGHETMTAIIVRHDLHDFLGSGDAFNLNANMTLSALQGVAARLGGAPATANPQTWLRNQGFVVPVRGATSPATTQEAIYTIMAVYELRSGNSVDSIRISNFNRAANIGGIDQRYRSSIAAAFELNIFTNNNMNPNASITVEEVLRMILAVNQRVGL